MNIEVNYEIVREYELSGVLCLPLETEADSAVIILGGSEGGMHEEVARAYAESGFAALALAYFGAEGVPSALEDIPLEYFAEAVTFLEDQGFPPGSIGLLGGSRGAEAALLFASRDHRIGAVVSVVGSGIVTEGIDFRLGRLDSVVQGETNSWTEQGIAIPYLPYSPPSDLPQLIDSGINIPLTWVFAPVPSDPEMLEQVSIPVERIAGAILLISATDDQMWDSVGYSAVAAERLREYEHPYPWDHLILERAGHGVNGLPGKPHTGTTSPGPGVTLEMGGTVERNTVAQAETWEASMNFLRTHLPRHPEASGY